MLTFFCGLGTDVNALDVCLDKGLVATGKVIMCSFIVEISKVIFFNV